MTSAEPAYPAWPGWALRPMWPTRFLTTSPARSQGLRLSTSATSFSRSARRLWTYGEPILASFSGKYPMTAEWI